MGLGGIALKEAIGVAAFTGALRSYVDVARLESDGAVVTVDGRVPIVVKSTHGEADTQGIAKADVDRAKVVVFARVKPGPAGSEIRHLVELRGFISRNAIKKAYKVTRYKTVPGYRVGVKRLRPITELLWWLQDGGHLHGQNDIHATDVGGTEEARV